MRARSAAAELAGWLEGLEKARIPYHLIAHSHGGNVVWRALRARLRKKRSVANLRSWTTVGTPFYRFRVTPPDIASVVPLCAAAAILFSPGRFPAPQQIWHVTVLMRPVMVAYGGQRVLPLLVFAMLGITVLIAAFVAAEWAIRLAASLVDSVKRQRDDRAYTKVAGRHAAIRSRQDEAITGLIGSLTIDGSGVRLVPRLPYLNQTLIGKLLSPVLLWPIALYNLTVAPWFNGELRRKLGNRMQGNPFRYSEVQSVGGTPGDGAPAPGQLNPEDEKSIAELAAAGAAETIAGMRGALGVFATGADLAVFRQQFAKRQLRRASAQLVFPVRGRGADRSGADSRRPSGGRGPHRGAVCRGPQGRDSLGTRGGDGRTAGGLLPRRRVPVSGIGAAEHDCGEDGGPYNGGRRAGARGGRGGRQNVVRGEMRDGDVPDGGTEVRSECPPPGSARLQDYLLLDDELSGLLGGDPVVERVQRGGLQTSRGLARRAR